MLTTRPVIPADRAFLCALYASVREDLALLDESIRENMLQMQYRVQQAQYAAAWPSAAHDLVLLSDVPIGQVLTAHTAAEVRIVDVSLLPQFRGQGLGAALLGRVLEAANAGPVRLSVAIDNPARHLYERLGFSTVGESPAYFEMEWRAAV